MSQVEQDLKALLPTLFVSGFRVAQTIVVYTLLVFPFCLCVGCPIVCSFELRMNRTHQCSFVTQQIDEGDPSNIQVKIYALQEREPMVQ
jgi:hypothetical protein